MDRETIAKEIRNRNVKVNFLEDSYQLADYIIAEIKKAYDNGRREAISVCDTDCQYAKEQVRKAKLETLEKVWNYTYNGLFLNEALNKIKSEV